MEPANDDLLPCDTAKELPYFARADELREDTVVARFMSDAPGHDRGMNAKLGRQFQNGFGRALTESPRRVQPDGAWDERFACHSIRFALPRVIRVAKVEVVDERAFGLG